MAKPKIVLGALAAIAAISAPVLMQERAIARAKAERAELVANGPSGQTVVQAPRILATAEMAGTERNELKRLRSEVAALRTRMSELSTQAQALAVVRMGSRPVRTTQPLAEFSMRDLKDVGENTPVDFLQTWMWAVLNGDTNRVMQLMALQPGTDMQRVQRAMEDLKKETEKGPEAMLEKGPLGGFRVLEEQSADNNDKWIVVEAMTNDGREDQQKLLLRPTPNGWRMVMGTDGEPVMGRMTADPKGKGER